MPVPYKVLAPQEHLDGSVFQFSLQFPETIPGVIVKKPDAAVKGRSAPGLDGEETYAVNGPGEREHIFSPQPGGDK
jgi:hypothetical protein